MVAASVLLFVLGFGLDHGDGGFSPPPPPLLPPPPPPPLPPPRPPPPPLSIKAAGEAMAAAAAVAALARLVITLEAPLQKPVVAAAGVLAAITAAGKEKRRMDGDGDGFGGEVINKQF